MKMEKLIAGVLSVILILALMAGCTGEPVASKNDPKSQAEDGAAGQSDETDNEGAPKEAVGDAVMTGLSISTSIAKSKSAEDSEDGLAQSDITLVAVTVDDEGIIDSCVIDSIQAKIEFTADGMLATALDTAIPSKNELGADYGMNAASSIDKEWDQQAAALAEYAVGKTVEELRGIAVDENGAPDDADLSSSVTISIGGYIEGIDSAVSSASHMGASRGDKLALTSETVISKSKDAQDGEEGVAQAYGTIAAITLQGDQITSCYIDAVQADVNFSAEGEITTDLNSKFPTKNELGADYGMAAASSIGKEWNQQAEAFCEYVTGKTVSEVLEIAVDESTSPQDEDLAASVTISIGGFKALIEKAAYYPGT